MLILSTVALVVPAVFAMASIPTAAARTSLTGGSSVWGRRDEMGNLATKAEEGPKLLE
jgi:hypothetical protein